MQGKSPHVDVELQRAQMSSSSLDLVVNGLRVPLWVSSVKDSEAKISSECFISEKNVPNSLTLTAFECDALSPDFERITELKAAAKRNVF
ncbi:hypothetical protein TNCV_770651 [Trichonephila clavipes]|nr:hypothetical protein TNCV_770651 [Trichonephila clavipes]